MPGGADESNREAFARGHVAGGIEEQLLQHDKHFQRINGSIERQVKAQHETNLRLQSIERQLVSDAATRIQLAQALKEAAEKQFIPWQRVAVIVGAITAAVALFLQYRGN